jgi:hypothetical protein
MALMDGLMPDLRNRSPALEALTSRVLARLVSRTVDLAARGCL